MTDTLLLAPHADDETLFASFLAQKYAANIVVVYDEGREDELSMATTWLGCPYVQLKARKGMDAEQVETFLNGLDPLDWERVIAPAIEDGGHEEHNLVGELATRLFLGDCEVIYFKTYAPRGQRSHGREVVPETPSMIARKLAALSCYRSQIIDPNTRSWFYELLDVREWIV